MSRYRDQVAAALGAVTIRGATRYAWLGRSSRAVAASVDRELDEDERRTYLVSCVREELYWSFYCRGKVGPARWGEPEPVSGDHALVRAVGEANTGRGSWEPGWRVERLEGNEVVAATPRLRARVRVSDCRPSRGGLRPGAVVSLRLPKELPALSPGFVMVVGDAVVESTAGAGVVRVYWHITHGGASALVRALTSRLNAQGVPFRLKIADHPFRFERCDAAVLYLQGADYRGLVRTLREVALELTPRLRPEIPAFTRELVPGVGLAEEASDGESFGLRRCAWLAEGIVRAHERGIAEVGERIATVADRFAEEAVELDAPYREPSFRGEHVL